MFIYDWKCHSCESEWIGNVLEQECRLCGEVGKRKEKVMATYDRKVTEQEDVATVVEFLRWGDPKDLMYHLAKHHTTLFAECLKEMNAPVVDWVPIDELLHQGRKIDAIKEYRAQTGQGLREAKDAVEDRQKRWRFGSSSPSEGATLGDILQNARKGVKE